MTEIKALPLILKGLKEDPANMIITDAETVNQAIGEFEKLEKRANIGDFLDGFVTLRHSKILHANSDGVKRLVAKEEYPEYLVNEAYELGWTECMKTIMKEWKKYRKEQDELG